MSGIKKGSFVRCHRNGEVLNGLACGGPHITEAVLVANDSTLAEVPVYTAERGREWWPVTDVVEVSS